MKEQEIKKIDYQRTLFAAKLTCDDVVFKEVSLIINRARKLEAVLDLTREYLRCGRLSDIYEGLEEMDENLIKAIKECEK